jgi:molybdate transport system substrate-binding protein
MIWNAVFGSAIVAVSILLSGCSRETAAPEVGPLRVLCGSSMAGPMQEIVRLFKENRAIEVLVDLGGSETLLPKILAGGSADVFVCHDPFEQKVKEAGRWEGAAQVGVLQPVLLVRPGNPLKIASLGDLARPEVKLGIGDPRYSTCGEMFVALLDHLKIREPVMARVALQGRAHTEIANGLILGPLDAVVVWNYVAQLYKDKVQLVPTSEAYPEIKVTVVGLKPSKFPAQRDAFLEFCRSPAAQEIFIQQGYAKPTATKP